MPSREKTCSPASASSDDTAASAVTTFRNSRTLKPIGTELTEAGSKLLGQLDFGFVNIEHSRHAWYEQKLKDPRIFDVGRVKRPEEL